MLILEKFWMTYSELTKTNSCVLVTEVSAVPFMEFSSNILEVILIHLYDFHKPVKNG